MSPTDETNAAEEAPVKISAPTVQQPGDGSDGEWDGR